MNILKFYNTLTRKKEIFTPWQDKKVGLYTCGPTVYNYAHIGNLRSYIFEDILKRVLLFNNYRVNHVMNITDVGHLTSDADEGEDKMEKGAKREGKTAWEIAEFYTLKFVENLHDLNVLEADILCRATDHIKEQITLVERLIAKGVAYTTSDGIYFDTTKIDDYGKLANLKKQKLKAGARIEMGEKKNPHDFALWKFTAAGEKRQMQWEAFGRQGFPGWHIECSAMSMKYLGEQFDIHCGGIDHIPVHHTNEIAQSETASGIKPWVKYWLHNEFLQIDGGKMAKSLGNIYTLQDIKDKGFNPLSLRYFMLGAHYKTKLNFTWEALAAAEHALNNIYSAVREWDKPKIGCAELEKKFLKAVNDDLNTPVALSVVWNLIKSEYPSSAKAETILKFDEILGLNIKNYLGKKIEIPLEIKKLMEERAEARKNKDWEKSDELRDKINQMGFTVDDTDEGQKII
ncbi:MAG: Cysteine-tRNA ligase [Candidatus Magasanikbacteria bacterium GW2011_GWC2_40_17]|uniref:Cysteine--tRNA ligase n=1 Tax=Candidatus Magasanikbacteria bacterium GW2011_GWA2_42_32 TaxID=1619039 RepID=A0A0G1A985_9BACT|nr:MAG: Cysteine-tRNA ligase [Candidatus Magasanikbacteria bacterium GW2011_GWC2_40_17]KKS57549.1 MAG: Cysteine-tRNA ligase [Candidatus Magasanikbacteria bacterium GW2011_GWA2_42_32]OGH85263.1 MAG: cysteine--tRNA ligase [Candidatus Magasanikbacteria bacterium RIFOXYB2_FULL_38_10]